MSNLNQFLSGVMSRSPTSIIRDNSVAGFTPKVATPGQADNATGAKIILSGALTAATLATLLTVTGGGVLEYLSISNSSGGVATRTIRLQLIIDGVTVWDFTSASTVNMSSGDGAIIVGGSANAPNNVAIPFNASLVVKIASSLTETDKLQIGVKYWTV